MTHAQDITKFEKIRDRQNRAKSRFFGGLAKKADIKYITHTRIKSGVLNKPSVQTMAKIAEALGVSIEDSIE